LFENITDILAIDEQFNLVIIEVKRGETPRDVISQALEYASDVAQWDYEKLNKRALKYFARHNLRYASLLEALADTFGISPSEFSASQFNQHQPIIIVGEAIEEKIERTARWLLGHGVSMNCLSYTCYLSGDESKEIFLDLQEVVRPTERQASRAEPVTPTEEEAVERLPDDLRKVYRELLRRAKLLGQDVDSYATRRNLIFKATRNFAEITLRRREGCLTFSVRPEGFFIEPGQSADVLGLTVTRVPDSFGWTLNHWFKVNSNSDMDAVTQLLHQSYEATHRKN
jgi:hypothetical protein